MSKNYNISLIKGDGIGVEIVDEAVKVLDAVGEKFNLNFFIESQSSLKRCILKILLDFNGGWL